MNHFLSSSSGKSAVFVLFEVAGSVSWCRPKRGYIVWRVCSEKFAYGVFYLLWCFQGRHFCLLLLEWSTKVVSCKSGGHSEKVTFASRVITFQECKNMLYIIYRHIYKRTHTIYAKKKYIYINRDKSIIWGLPKPWNSGQIIYSYLWREPFFEAALSTVMVFRQNPTYIILLYVFRMFHSKHVKPSLGLKTDKQPAREKNTPILPIMSCKMFGISFLFRTWWSISTKQNLTWPPNISQFALSPQPLACSSMVLGRCLYLVGCTWRIISLRKFGRGTTLMKGGLLTMVISHWQVLTGMILQAFQLQSMLVSGYIVHIFFPWWVLSFPQKWHRAWFRGMLRNHHPKNHENSWT